MAKRRSTPQQLPDAVRDAVERTVQATLGGAQQTRGALDEVVSGAEANVKNVRARVREAVEKTRPATSDDIKELRAEIRALSRRLDKLEKKPASRSRSSSSKRS
jgi:polyhydroxyalkanoate synthesis regulator phasin